MPSKVVLPLPFGPSIPYTDPVGTVRLTSFSARTELYDLRMLFICRMADTAAKVAENTGEHYDPNLVLTLAWQIS